VQVFDKDTLAFKRQYAAELFYPKHVAVDADGFSYVTSYGGERISVYASDGSWLRDIPLGPGTFPEGLCIDPTTGNLVVTDTPTGVARISVWTRAGALVRSWEPATGAYDVWVSASGEVLAAAFGGIYRYNSTGTLLGQFTPRYQAAALCGDDTGMLYITYFDHAAVDAYSLAGELQATYEMTPCALETPYSGFAFGVTYSGPNQLFVTDRATHKVARLKIVRQRCADCGQ
jgi:sugar lactone lactonase YvrE